MRKFACDKNAIYKTLAQGNRKKNSRRSCFKKDFAKYCQVQVVFKRIYLDMRLRFFGAYTRTNPFD